MTGFEIAILFVIVYWLFGPRVIAMVDVLSTHMRTMYDTWNRHAFQQPDLNMFPSIKRQVALKRRQREQNVAQGRDVPHLKKHPWNPFPQKDRNDLKEPCSSCDKNIQVRASIANPNDDHAVNILMTPESQSESFWVRTFSDLVRHYNYPSYTFPKIKDTVLTDERVQNAITETVSQELMEAEGEITEDAYQKLMAKYTRKALGVVKYMHSTLSNFMIKLASYVMYKLLPGYMSSVCVHPGQVEMVKRASQGQVPIVYVPLHRSHMDYILIIFVMLGSGLRPPLVAAGMNLNIPFFGKLLRGLGAFFIKRRIEATSGRKDLIYRTALHSYMVQALQAGHTMKFYIEGGRTRTGKPLLPKVGLLSVIVDAFMDGSVEDVLLVPVSVNYDKIVDGNFVREALGQPKQKETFTSALRAIWTTLTTAHGSCSVNFNQPYSLKELVSTFQSATTRVAMPTEIVPGRLTSQDSSASLHGTDVVSEDQKALVEHIANHLVYDSTEACAVMSTNVVAWLLLTRCRSGTTLGTLVHLIDDLRCELVASRKHLGFSGDSVDVANFALSLLGENLVKREPVVGGTGWDEIITPVTALPNVIELSYYANALLPQYVLPSIVATSAFSLMKDQPEAKVHGLHLKEVDLISHSQELCEILQYEFLYQRPCQQLDSMLKLTLHDLSLRGILPVLKLDHTRKGYSYDFSDDEDDEVVSSTYTVSTSEAATDELRYLTLALRPLLDTYTVTVMTLYRLVGRQVTEGDYVKEVLDEISTQLQTGFCLYGESCSVDPIRNACRLLKKWGVLETFTQDSVKLVYLSQQYDNRPTIDRLVAQFNKFKYLKNS